MTKKDPKTDKLTIKQRKFVKHYLEHGNATQAALHAYNCKDENSANALGSEVLGKLSIESLMEDYGISDRKLLQKLDEGLDATKVVSARIVGKDANSQTDDFIDVEDYAVRHKYLETALKLKKRLGNESGASGPNVQVNVNLDRYLESIDATD